MSADFLRVSAAYLLGASASEPEEPQDMCSIHARAYRGMLDREIAVLIRNELEERLAEIQPRARDSRSASNANPAPTACGSTNGARAFRRMPVNVEVKPRASVTAEFANELEPVNQ